MNSLLQRKKEKGLIEIIFVMCLKKTSKFHPVDSSCAIATSMSSIAVICCEKCGKLKLNLSSFSLYISISFSQLNFLVILFFVSQILRLPESLPIYLHGSRPFFSFHSLQPL
jgi:hypothetical protein